MVSFAFHKLIGFIRSHVFIFAFVSLTLGDRLKKSPVIYVREYFDCSFL